MMITRSRKRESQSNADDESRASLMQQIELEKLSSKRYDVNLSENGLQLLISPLENSDHEMKRPDKMVIEFLLSLPVDIEKECMDLFKQNMQYFYENSSFGFDQNEKVEEFRHSNAQFLVCRECVSSSICAFCHFRFEEDMLYIWEIQINNKNQGLGLGRLLMSILDLVTLSRGLRKIMLTAFIANQNAVEFYKKLGFKVDKSETPKDADYLIFYKYMSLSQRSKRRNHRKR